MTLAQLHVPSLTVSLYSSEQGKMETLRLDLRIMSNEISAQTAELSSVARAIICKNH